MALSAIQTQCHFANLGIPLGTQSCAGRPGIAAKPDESISKLEQQVTGLLQTRKFQIEIDLGLCKACFFLQTYILLRPQLDFLLVFKGSMAFQPQFRGSLLGSIAQEFVLGLSFKLSTDNYRNGWGKCFIFLSLVCSSVTCK